MSIVLSTTRDPAEGRTVTPLLVTTYENDSEARVIVLEPINGMARIVLAPHGQYRHLTVTGTWVLTFDSWATARAALDMVRGLHTDTVCLVADDDELGGVSYLEVFPRRVRHRVLPDELDMHEITVEWVQAGGSV